MPEFEQLVGHEVVPGHVTTSALIQGLYVRGRVGFESTILAMNTRWGTLAEGIGNNAVLIALGLTEVEQVPDEDLQVGTLARAPPGRRQEPGLVPGSWQEGMPQAEIAATLRRDFLVSEERAGKFAGAWGRHPLFGRMNLPAYRAGTETVAELRRRYPAKRVLPALYGCAGLVDVVTLRQAVVETPPESGALRHLSRRLAVERRERLGVDRVGLLAAVSDRGQPELPVLRQRADQVEERRRSPVPWL